MCGVAGGGELVSVTGRAAERPWVWGQQPGGSRASRGVQTRRGAGEDPATGRGCLRTTGPPPRETVGAAEVAPALVLSSRRRTRSQSTVRMFSSLPQFPAARHWSPAALGKKSQRIDEAEDGEQVAGQARSPSGSHICGDFLQSTRSECRRNHRAADGAGFCLMFLNSQGLSVLT